LLAVNASGRYQQARINDQNRLFFGIGTLLAHQKKKASQKGSPFLFSK
jgi:hypothetical protein